MDDLNQFLEKMSDQERARGLRLVGNEIRALAKGLVIEHLCLGPEDRLILHRGYMAEGGGAREEFQELSPAQAEAYLGSPFRLSEGGVAKGPDSIFAGFWALLRGLLDRPLLEGKFFLQVVPYTRMTQRSKFSPRSQRYLQAREALQWGLWSVWGKEPYEGPVIMACRASFSDRRPRDCDNVLKAVNDALTGIVLADDRQVRTAFIEVAEGEDGLEIALWAA